MSCDLFAVPEELETAMILLDAVHSLVEVRDLRLGAKNLSP